MWLRQKDRLAYSYRSKPKMLRTKRSQKFCAEMAACPLLCVCVCLCVCLCMCMCVPASQCLSTHLFRNVCVLYFVGAYCSMCSYAPTVCACSRVSVELFYQAVTECQPLRVRGAQTAERRLLPSSSPHSDDYCLVIIPPLFSPHEKKI